MRKSVILPGVAVAGGLVGLLVRRVYLAHGFEAGTGLPISGAPQSVGHGPCLGGGGGRAAGSEPGQAPQVRPVLHRRFLAGHHPSALRRPGRAVLLAIGGFLALAAWAGSPRTPAGTADDEHCLGRAGGFSACWPPPASTLSPRKCAGAPPFSPPGPWSPALPAACGSWPTTTRAGRRSPCWVST